MIQVQIIDFQTFCKIQDGILPEYQSKSLQVAYIWSVGIMGMSAYDAHQRAEMLKHV